MTKKPTLSKDYIKKQKKIANMLESNINYEIVNFMSNQDKLNKELLKMLENIHNELTKRPR
jgi:hypothetical protein